MMGLTSAEAGGQNTKLVTYHQRVHDFETFLITKIKLYRYLHLHGLPKPYAWALSLIFDAKDFCSKKDGIQLFKGNIAAKLVKFSSAQNQ